MHHSLYSPSHNIPIAVYQKEKSRDNTTFSRTDKVFEIKLINYFFFYEKKKEKKSFLFNPKK